MIFKFLKIIILSLNIIHNSQSFELGYWRGPTYSYYKVSITDDKSFLDEPKIIFYYNQYNNYKSFINIKDNNLLSFKFQAYDKIGGVTANIHKEVNFNTYLKNEINFYYNSARSIINFCYTTSKNNYELELSSIEISAFRCGLVKTYTYREKLNNITQLIDKIERRSFCKTTFINAKTPTYKQISLTNSFEYAHLLTNDNNKNNKRIIKILKDNIIISLPEFIEENKPFSFLIGCLISANSYKQLNLNYNFNGCLSSLEFNEYEPYLLKNSP